MVTLSCIVVVFFFVGQNYPGGGRKRQPKKKTVGYMFLVLIQGEISLLRPFCTSESLRFHIFGGLECQRFLSVAQDILKSLNNGKTLESKQSPFATHTQPLLKS